MEYSSILEADSIPNIEGMPILSDRSRRADSADESLGFIKYTLAQIEIRRLTAIVSEIDKNDLKYPEGHAPDVYKPLKDLLDLLLPHLKFVGID